jgi:uncharacterized membrane protein
MNPTKTRKHLLPFLAAAALALSTGAHGQYVLAPIVIPGHSNITATGINNHGVIVGNDDSGAFIKDGDTLTHPTIPGASSISVSGINNSGTTIGNAYPGGAFVRTQDGQVTTLADPRGLDLSPHGINDRGEVVGSENFIEFGFIWDNGNITLLGVTGARFTFLNAINSAGVIVGGNSTAFTCTNGVCSAPTRFFVTDKSGAEQKVGDAKLKNDVTFTLPELPHAAPVAINSHGTIAGNYYAQGSHGFVLNGGQITTLDFPHTWAPNFVLDDPDLGLGPLHYVLLQTGTTVSAINDLGDVVGSNSALYEDDIFGFDISQSIPFAGSPVH